MGVQTKFSHFLSSQDGILSTHLSHDYIYAIHIRIYKLYVYT